MRNGRKIANHARMNIRLTSKVSAGKQNFCPAEAFLLTLKQILPDSQKSANYPYRVKEMQNLSAVTKTGWIFYGNRAGNHCAFISAIESFNNFNLAGYFPNRVVPIPPACSGIRSRMRWVLRLRRDKLSAFHHIKTGHFCAEYPIPS